MPIAKRAFVGQDLEGDFCIYVVRDDETGIDREYLSEDELQGICEQLNQQRGWSNADR